MAQDFLKLFNLEGKTAVITGGGGDLCGNMAEALGGLGVKVAILDIDGIKAENRKQAVNAAGGRALALTCDVLNRQQLQDCREAVIKEWKAVDFLINGAGGNDPAATTSMDYLDRKHIDDNTEKTFFDLGLADYRRVFDLNFLGTFLTTQVFSRPMVERGSGSIVNISSMTADIPLTKVSGYSAAKAAVSNFTRWLAVHFAHTGVRVNAIAPGFFMTEQLRFLHVDPQTGQLSERARKVIERTPMDRYGEPDDLVGVLIWLLSDAARFVTGIVVPIDGGFTAYKI